MEQTAVEFYNSKIKLFESWVETKQISWKEYHKEKDNLIEQAKEMENKQIIEFTLFRDNYFEKADTLEDFTISNEELIRLFKNETIKSE